MMNYTIEQMAEKRWFLRFTDTNNKGETLTIELSKCEDSDFSKSLPKLWAKGGYIDRVLETYWSIQTYVKDSEGRSWGMYNPQHKLNEEKTRMVINFDWMLEATEENKERLINEVYRLFSTATGKSATELKREKIKEYAKKNNMIIYNVLPNGWNILECAMTNPNGTELICNKESFKSGKRQTALLLNI